MLQMLQKYKDSFQPSPVGRFTILSQAGSPNFMIEPKVIREVKYNVDVNQSKLEKRMQLKAEIV